MAFRSVATRPPLSRDELAVDESEEAMNWRPTSLSQARGDKATAAAAMKTAVDDPRERDELGANESEPSAVEGVPERGDKGAAIASVHCSSSQRRVDGVPQRGDKAASVAR